VVFVQIERDHLAVDRRPFLEADLNLDLVTPDNLTHVLGWYLLSVTKCRPFSAAGHRSAAAGLPPPG